MSEPSVHSVQVRPATGADADAIERVEQESFSHAAERFGLRKIRYLIHSPRVIVLVAERQGHVAGWGAGIVGGRPGKRWGRIFALAVRPQARGLKLGHRLMHDLISGMAARGARTMYLEVREDNAAAIALYHRMGFKTMSTLHDYYAKGLHALRMCR